MQRLFLIISFALQAARLSGFAADSRAELAGTYTLPRTSLSQLGNPACSPAALEKARRNGLNFTDLPSIGSGLAKSGENEFVGLTDRGPNGTAAAGDDDVPRRTFPLPQFCPAIVRFKLAEKEIRILECLPLRDSRGALLNGLSNVKGEERLYESPDAKQPLIGQTSSLHRPKACARRSGAVTSAT